ncbi:hypothetical protein EMCRGX_G032612 [Ephydatia muelleri]
MATPALSLHLLAAIAVVTPNVFATAAAASDGVACLHVNTATNRIVDSFGRERYFHGVNVVMKGPPWLPATDKFDPIMSFVEEDMQLLQDLGLNAIRLGLMWPGAEPQRGIFNQTYFDASVALVNKAGQYGIYSLLDMHQDCLSEKFCGEGVPDWAVNTGSAKPFPLPRGPPFSNDPSTGYPYPEDCAKYSWSDYQVTQAGSAAYQALYNNTDGLRDSWATFWAHAAQQFADNPFILGYELINEPFAGYWYDNPDLLVPTVADKVNLAPAYEVLNAAIREVDDCHNVFFESVTWDELNVGFEQVPGGPDYANRSVLSYHFYIPPCVSQELSFSMRNEDIERLHCAGFLTEFDISYRDGNQDQIIETMDVADQYLQSWLGWEYKPFDPITGADSSIWYSNGTLDMSAIDILSRTYAMAVAGVTTSMTYSASSKNFDLIYRTSSLCTSAVTQVYLNEGVHYSSGYDIIATPMDSLTWWSPSKNLVEVIHNPSLPDGTEIHVQILPNL